MRLEIEPTLAPPQVTDETSNNDHRADAVEAKSALNRGIKAAQAGNRAQARASLLLAAEIDPRSESAWLWLASISEYPEELLGFLNNVLDINPENQRALEWKAATHALLSKTFVQRGIDASQENQKEFAADCFQTALEYNEQNAAAWLWMASLVDSNTVKVSMLEKALAIEPDNEDVVTALDTAKNGILKERLTEAKTAAVAGNNAEAVRIIDTLLETNPDSIDAWTMRSHLAEGFDEKIRCFESILAIDPTNVAAKASRDSLLSIFGTVEAANAVADEPLETVAEVPDEMAAKSPTEDLEAAPEQQHDPVDPFAEPAYEEQYESPAALSETTPEELNESPVAYSEPTPQEENEDTTMEPGEEPFGSFAEETPAPAQAEYESRELTADDEVSDLAAMPADADPQAETVAFSYAEAPQYSESVDEPFDESVDFVSAPEIPMPADDLPVTASADAEEDIHVTHVAGAVTGELVMAKPESVDCPFCGNANDPQSYSCGGCMCVLTLSDLELLLANQDANKMVLRQAIEEMERHRPSRQFESDELVTLGIGHLNLRNLQLGYSCLLEASKLDPNNVVLAGQVNALLIRLEEIKQQEEAHLKMPKGKSILVVDDSPTVRKLISGKLEKCGHDVICANDGVEAMERLEHFVPDLVLLDITMPRMDGYQVCKTIRSNNSTKDVPVVMISGKDGFFDKVRGRMAGTTGYITKPFGPETLMKAVEMYLSGEIPESNEV